MVRCGGDMDQDDSFGIKGDDGANGKEVWAYASLENVGVTQG